VKQDDIDLVANVLAEDAEMSFTHKYDTEYDRNGYSLQCVPCAVQRLVNHASGESQPSYTEDKPVAASCNECDTAAVDCLSADTVYDMIDEKLFDVVSKLNELVDAHNEHAHVTELVNCGLENEDYVDTL
jgi:hypothetical protein